jgi:hypothetical protein
MLFIPDLGPVKSKSRNNFIPGERIVQQSTITPNPSQETGRSTNRKAAPIELRMPQLLYA